jgi:hypothetical protein
MSDQFNKDKNKSNPQQQQQRPGQNQGHGSDRTNQQPGRPLDKSSNINKNPSQDPSKDKKGW